MSTPKSESEGTRPPVRTSMSAQDDIAVSIDIGGLNSLARCAQSLLDHPRGPLRFVLLSPPWDTVHAFADTQRSYHLSR